MSVRRDVRDRFYLDDDCRAWETGVWARLVPHDDPDHRTIWVQMRYAAKAGTEIEPYPGVPGLWRPKQPEERNAGDQVRGWRRRCHARMAAMNEAEERRLLATLNEPRIPAAECFRKPALDAMSDAAFARLTLTEAEDICGFDSGEPDEGGLYHLRYVNELRRRLLRRDGDPSPGHCPADCECRR